MAQTAAHLVECVIPRAPTRQWVVSVPMPLRYCYPLELESGELCTTGRARIRVRYAGEPRGPDSLFVKLPPFDAAGREWVQSTGMGRREARFYAELAAELPVRLPQSYFAAFDEMGSPVAEADRAFLSFPVATVEVLIEHSAQGL